MKTLVCGMTAFLAFIAILGIGAYSSQSAHFVSREDAVTIRGGQICVDPSNWYENAPSGDGCWNRKAQDRVQNKARCNQDVTHLDQICICASVSQGIGCFVGSGSCDGPEQAYIVDEWITVSRTCDDVFYGLANGPFDGCTDTCAP